MKFTPLALDGVIRVELDVFRDVRGAFMETWHAHKYAEGGLPASFVQDNWSESAKGVLRGLHYQSQQPQGKLVRVTAGAVFDVAVDIRPQSPSYGVWVGEILSADNRRQLWIPAGLAHGFLVVSEGAEFLYKTTDFYAPQHEKCIRWDDPTLNITWPLNGAHPQLSGKDTQGQLFLDTRM